MTKRLLTAMCLLLALLMAASACAEPLLTNGTYTAYLGSSNFMYLADNLTGTTNTRVLQLPVSNLLGMTDTALYLVDQNGRLCQINLDGSNPSVLAANPTEEELAAVTAVRKFNLSEDGSLYLTNNLTTPVATNVISAGVAGNTLYFVESGAITGVGNTLKSIDLTGDTPAATTLRLGVSRPLSLTASPTAVTLVTYDKTYEIIDLEESAMLLQGPTANEKVVAALCYNGKLIQFSQDDTGRYLVEDVQDYAGKVEPTVAPAAAPTATLEPTKAPQPTVTPKPTATKKPSSSSTSNDDDGRISKGASGSKVRKMQERLSALGYPVGKADGVFGKNTLLAVNLFQCAIGYTERSYASAKMLERLYNRDAPEYDPYATLREGDKGTDVRLMQEALDKLGYDIGKKGVDGVFGKATKAAVEKFQFLAGFEKVTGDADADTLKLLFSEDAPKYTDKPVTPDPKPDPDPEPEPDPDPKPDPEPDPEPEPDPNPDPDPDPKPDPDPDPKPDPDPDPDPKPEPDPDPEKPTASSTDMK